MYYGERSNVILGMIGAILGDILGIALYLLIYRFNVWGFIGAVFLCTFVFRGYQLLGGAMDVNGLILCSLICIVSIYPTELAAVTFDLMDALRKQGLLFDDSFWNMYKRTPSLIPLAGDKYKVMYWVEVIAGYIMLITIVIDYIFRKGVGLRRRKDDYAGYNLIGKEHAATDQDSESYSSENHGGNHSDENSSDENYLL